MELEDLGPLVQARWVAVDKGRAVAFFIRKSAAEAYVRHVNKPRKVKVRKT